MEPWQAANLANWEERAPAHAASADYALDRFVADPRFLSDVVRFDLPRLGAIDGLRGVHLQCHIGTDTLSLARLGATMTGLDFSPAALAEAQRLADATGAVIDYVHADVYDAVGVLGPSRFDLVFTGIGALCWLPDIDRWAGVVVDLLAPGGRLFVREGHPMLWTIEEAALSHLEVRYPYFETAEPYVETSSGTYVSTDTTFRAVDSYTWNHGLGELFSALLDRGMRITGFAEHDSIPWEGLAGRMVLGDDGEYRLTEGRERLPLSYTLQAVKAQ